MESVAEAIGPWLPRDVADLSGGFEFTASADVTNTQARLTKATLELTEPSMQYASRHLSQAKVEARFDGNYFWPNQQFQAHDLTVSSSAFSVRVSGKSDPQSTDLKIQWRALLDRLQGSVRKPIARNTIDSAFRQVGYRSQNDSTVPANQWSLAGDCEGRVVWKQRQGIAELEVDAQATDFAILQPLLESARYQMVGPEPRPTGNPKNNNVLSSERMVWAEPNLKFVGNLRYDADNSLFQTDGMQVAGDWFATTLKGRLEQKPDGEDLLLEGPARLKMNEVAGRLTSLLGIDIHAEGIQETPLMIRARRGKSGSNQLSVKGNLGWEAGEVAGVRFGPASVPVRLNETTVEIAPSRIPVGQGFVNLAGQVHYRPGPVWLQIDRGRVAESVQITPEMSRRWLKYLAPLVADATQIQGLLGAEIDEAVIVFDHPEQSRVIGRLNVGNVQLDAGPLANQLLVGIQQLQALSEGLKGTPPTRSGKTLMRMPAQTVDFAVSHGLVSHERLFFEVDRAQVVTSGRVSLDGRLNMIAMVPLDPRWLGNDLKSLAGQTVTLPIDGTLSRPSLDSSGVAQVVTQLGAQAVQSTAENYLQQQLNRGLEKLFGR
jgi:hypothetical protein